MGFRKTGSARTRIILTNYAEHAASPAKDYDKADKVSNTPGALRRALQGLSRAGRVPSSSSCRELGVQRSCGESERVVVDAQLHGAHRFSSCFTIPPAPLSRTPPFTMAMAVMASSAQATARLQLASSNPTKSSVRSLSSCASVAVRGFQPLSLQARGRLSRAGGSRSFVWIIRGNVCVFLFIFDFDIVLANWRPIPDLAGSFRSRVEFSILTCS